MIDSCRQETQPSPVSAGLFILNILRGHNLRFCPAQIVTTQNT